MSQQRRILAINNLHKSFGGVHALNDVSFAVESSEVHAIVGENGAGKSTLMNILAGVYAPDSGTILLDNQPYAPSNSREARAQGISIVFQELALFPSLSVSANLFAGKEQSKGFRLDHEAMNRITTTTLEQMQIDLAPAVRLETLSIGQQQWVEIARALTDDARILILDEPNSALNQHETQALFRLITNLKVQGVTILYISHRLEEVFQIADHITVLRDGHYINTWPVGETSTTEIVAAMVGHRTTDVFARQSSSIGKEALSINDLQVNGRLEPVSFQVKSGEILGLAGLAGSGVTDVMETLFGVQQATAGAMSLAGDTLQIRSPRMAMHHDMAMVPADRRGLGLLMNWNVRNNITLSILPRLSKFGVLRHREAEEVARDYVENLRIVTEGLDKGIVYLSGGNQQKTLLARWLATHPRVLLLEDPTRGIDVGAKQEIYQLIDETAAQGVAVVFTSSEIEETLALCDRILVFRNGAIVAEVPTAIADKELILEFMAGSLQVGQQRLAMRLADSPSSPERQMPAALGSAEIAHRPEVPTAPQSQVERWIRNLLGIREIGVGMALVAVLVLFSFLTPHFLTVSNLLLISRQMAILGVITVGMTYVLASGEVDLSVGWMFNIVMGTMAVLSLQLNLDPWLLVPVGLLVGTLLGVINGLLAVLLDLPSIIVTLGTLTLYRGVALAIIGGQTVGNLPESTFFGIGKTGVFSIPNMTLVMLLVYAVTAWILRNSRFARQLLAMGSNTSAAERVGIRTRWLRVQVMAFSGLMCGIAGILGLAFLGAADPQSGTGYELTAIAAAIIGGAQLGGGSGTVWGSLIGIALIMAIQNGLVLVELRPAWQTAATGIVIIAAVTLDYLTRLRRERIASRTMSGS